MEAQLKNVSKEKADADALLEKHASEKKELAKQLTASQQLVTNLKEKEQGQSQELDRVRSQLQSKQLNCNNFEKEVRGLLQGIHGLDEALGYAHDLSNQLMKLSPVRKQQAKACSK
jgi:predicted  nucleic acid-binding Zn-ribbon protein